MNKITFPIGYYPDPTKGKPISGGSIYIGEPDTDPTILGNQKTIYALRECGAPTIEISQPVSLSAGGVPVYNGSPVSLFVDGRYSIRVNNALGSQEYYIPDSDIDSLEEADYVNTFDNIAALRAITSIPTSTTAIVQGYYIEGDDGGGIFYWDATSTETDNNGTIIKATAIATGRWKRVYDGAIDVRWFGAKGDWNGSTGTDNYTFFYNAINALPQYGTLIISSGRYATSDEVALQDDMTVLCYGEIILTGATSGGALIAPYGVSNVTWEGGVLDGNSITGQNIIGTSGSVSPCTNVVFKNLTCKNALWDSVILGGKGFTIHQDCSAIRYKNIVVEDCSIGFAVEGFDLKPSPANIIEDIIVRRATRTPVWLVQGGATGLDDSRNFSCIIDNVEIEDCDIDPTTNFAMVSCDRATNIQGHFKISGRGTTKAVNLLMGTITNSRLTIDADLNNCQDIINWTDINGGQPTADSYDNNIDIRVKISGTHSGYWMRLDPGVNDITASNISIKANGATGALSDDVVSSSIHFDFIRLSNGFRAHGRTNTIPAFDTVARERLYTLSAAVIDELEITYSAGASKAIIRPYQGTYELELRNGADNPVIQTKTPTSGQTAILLRYHNGTTEVIQNVTLGAADSGGAGFKVLRVPN